MKFIKKHFCVVCMSFLPCTTLFAQRSLDTPENIPVAESEMAQAYYDAATGDIHLAVGENLVLVGLTGAPFAFVDGEFDPTLVRQDTALGQTTGSTQVAWQDLGGLPSGIFDIGSLLPIGENIFSPDDFDAAYPEAELLFAVPGNVSRVPLNVIPIRPQAIPEPGSGGLLMLAGAFFASRRRRR